MTEEGVGEDGIKTLATVGLLGAGGYLLILLMKEKKEPPTEKEITAVRYE